MYKREDFEQNRTIFKDFDVPSVKIRGKRYFKILLATDILTFELLQLIDRKCCLHIFIET